MIVGETCHPAYPNVLQKIKVKIERKRYIGVQLVQMEPMHCSTPPTGILARCVRPQSFFLRELTEIISKLEKVQDQIESTTGPKISVLLKRKLPLGPTGVSSALPVRLLDTLLKVCRVV
jgi:hypothetical protein